MKILKTQLILKRITNPKKLGTTLCSHKKKKKKTKSIIQGIHKI